MAGNRHQFILGLVIKKMREEGATVYAVDGNYPGLFGEAIFLPPQILRHRPDAIGKKEDGQLDRLREWTKRLGNEKRLRS